MAILAVSRDLQDLRARLGAITAGYSYDGGKPVTAEDLQRRRRDDRAAQGRDQAEPRPDARGPAVLMHCGPFANIAHGNNSLLADLIGLKLGDYVVTESGFGSDMGW